MINKNKKIVQNFIEILCKIGPSWLLISILISMVFKGATLNAQSVSEVHYLDVRASINSKCMAIDAKQPEVSKIDEYNIIASGQDTTLRIYTPEGKSYFPLILFLHGGAWVAGNLETHDNLARYLCKNTQAVVISVDYLTSPEGKFPTALEQGYEALLWALDHAELLQTDSRIAVVGDSAGGNMAAALCLMARDLEGPKINYQVLINPAPDLSCNGILEYQEDKLDILRWQAKMYTKTSDQANLQYVSPSLAKDFTGLPPALVLVAEFDDLRQDGELYASKLRAAGVPTNIYCQWGAAHLAGEGARASNSAIESLDIAVAALKAAFLSKN